jgi:hypothetical protein
LFGLNISLSAFSPNVFNLCFSRNIIDQVSHPYETTVKEIGARKFHVWCPASEPPTITCINTRFRFLTYVWCGRLSVRNVVHPSEIPTLPFLHTDRLATSNWKIAFKWKITLPSGDEIKIFGSKVTLLCMQTV